MVIFFLFFFFVFPPFGIDGAFQLYLSQACRKENIRFIVAPYEADAQLAYLAHRNIVQVCARSANTVHNVVALTMPPKMKEKYN